MGWTSRLSNRLRRLRTGAAPALALASAAAPPAAAPHLRIVPRDEPGAESDTVEYVKMAYRVVLQREAEPGGLSWWTPRLESGTLSRDQFLSELIESAEFRLLQTRNATHEIRGSRALHALHASRVQVVRQLPRASTIVDLGGSWEGRPEGALVYMGYPYRFKHLTIVDLPREQRHEVYANICGEYTDTIDTRLGPVSYVYTSLAYLEAFADASVDLVYSGQSIEHVTREDAARACREVHRILRPGGHFCLDTPNRAVTVLQSPDRFINPDHKHEYTHDELSALLCRNGFTIQEAKGLNLAAESVAQGQFLIEELIDHPGLYDDISRCYVLFYRCQKV